MLVFQTQRLGRYLKNGKSNNPGDGQRDSKYIECLDVVNFLSGLLLGSSLQDKPCLPIFRLEEEHFERNDEVKVYFKGEWVTGKVVSAPQPELRTNPFGRSTYIRTSMMVVEIRSNEPQLIEIDARDARIFKEHEYEYLVSGKDPRYLQIMQLNCQEYLLGACEHEKKGRCYR